MVCIIFDLGKGSAAGEVLKVPLCFWHIRARREAWARCCVPNDAIVSIMLWCIGPFGSSCRRTKAVPSFGSFCVAAAVAILFIVIDSDE